MWDRSDFEYEIRRLNEDAERCERWLAQGREDEVAAGLARLRAAHGRLLEKIRQRLPEDGEELFDPSSLLGKLAGVIVLSRQDIEDGAERCPVCGEAVSVMDIFSEALVRRDEGWCHQSCASPRRWPGPSEN